MSLNLAILGCGAIAGTVSETIAKLPEFKLYAAASRDLEKAKKFANKYGYEIAYGSYDEMLKDPNVDFVYICTLHNCHFENIMACLENGKHVLCEKAFTINAKEARKAAAFAREKKLYLAEAIWPRYMPSAALIDSLISGGKIGKPHYMTANLSYVIDGHRRITDINQAGGALLDIGVYGLNFALMHFG